MRLNRPSVADLKFMYALELTIETRCNTLLCFWGRHERRYDVMVNKPEHSPAKVSRRLVLLHGAACVTGAATILVANANSANANPLPKTAVNYQDAPKGDRQCSNCSLFVAPNACKNVAGDISPNGWCVLWRKI